MAAIPNGQFEMAGGGRGRSTTRLRAASQTAARSWPYTLLLIFWVLLLFEPDQFLTSKVGGPFYRIPTVLAPFILWFTIQKKDKRAIYWPLILFLVMHLFASFLAPNAGMARGPFKTMMYFLILFAASISLLDSPEKMKTVLKVYLLSFIWFAVQGYTSPGRITWHPLLDNEDSYGPLMVMLIPVGFFFAQAVPPGKWRWIARVGFMLGVLGVIISFARGAALGMFLVMLYVILRTPNKMKTLGFMIVAVIILIPLITTLVPIEVYKAEIASATGGDEGREALWKLAVMVFKTSPIWGVGAGNFGVVGVSIAPEEIQGQLGAGIYMLAVHNTHLQVLAEEGLVGTVLWLTILFTIYRWLRYLRTPRAQQVWEERGGKGWNLRTVSLGLEGAWLGYLGTTIFYNQIYIHWIWSLLVLSYVLFHLSGGAPVPALRNTRGSPRRSQHRPASN